MPATIMASPAMTPPTIAPTFDSLLVAAAEVGVEVTEVGVEVTEVGVEVTEAGVKEVTGEADIKKESEVLVGLVGLVEVAPFVDAATVD